MTTRQTNTVSSNRTSRFLLKTSYLLLSSVLLIGSPAWAGPFIDAVVSFTPGPSGGFGEDSLPGIVLGPPHGGGLLQGSSDVVSLGIGGSIVVRFDPPVICDGPGPDFTVFENVFHIGSATGPLFTEYGFVAVSQDGEHFVEMPYDPVSHAGLAGQQPVLSNPDNGIDPLDPSVSGGDPFDLAAVGLTWAAYVRITDVAGAIPDIGDLPQFSVAPSAGFDLDAIAAVHACDPNGVSTLTPTATATPTMSVPTPTATLSATLVESTSTATPSASLAEVTATTTPTRPLATATVIFPEATSTTTPSPSPEDTPPTATPPAMVLGDLDGDGQVTATDVAELIAELFYGDDAAADVNGDQRITAADLVAIQSHRSR